MGHFPIRFLRSISDFHSINLPMIGPRMKLRIRAEESGLSLGSREDIEKRIRLALGTRSVSIDSVDVVLTQGASLPSSMRCQLSLRDSKGSQTFVEEDAEDLASAVKWVVWRMVHFLDRRALRES